LIRGDASFAATPLPPTVNPAADVQQHQRHEDSERQTERGHDHFGHSAP
jgi:hypothetical protein